MTRFQPFSNRILFLSDAAESHSGLGRCARDLASLVATMPEFKVGFLGRGSVGACKLPWTQYSYPADTGGWGEDYLAAVARDFFEGQRGIVFSNWDVSRLTWLPKRQERDWDAWLYTPVDSVGPDGTRLTQECRDSLSSFNRVMAASEFGMGVLKASGRPDADWMPHGLFSIFHPHRNPRPLLGWGEHDVWVGFVAANQARKDFPVAFETAMILKKTYGPKFRFWVHTDKDIHYWNIYALAADYGVSDCLQLTRHASDEQLALRYSSCDCTILPTASEGFGYPIAESLACGTPCIVTDYAAGPELVAEDCRVKPVAYRVDTVYNVQRAVLSGYGFARAAEEQIDRKRVDWEYRSEELSNSVAHLAWDRLKHPWMRYFKAGLHEQ